MFSNYKQARFFSKNLQDEKVFKLHANPVLDWLRGWIFEKNCQVKG
jgi:hypothetical protein